jgi:hypothetical protein
VSDDIEERIEALAKENASLADAAHRSRADLLDAQAERERLRGLLATASRKLGYLLRDYPDDKETWALLASIAELETP